MFRLSTVKSKLMPVLPFLVLNFMILSCSSFQGAYVDPDAPSEMLDDRWNEDDAKITGNKLIYQMLYDNWKAVSKNVNTKKYERSWLKKYMYKVAKKKKKSRKLLDGPVILFKDIENRTSEHIPVKALNEAIQYELVNSGKVRFSNFKDHSEKQIVNQLKKQNESGMFAPKTIKKIGRLVGADYLLTGVISSQVHERSGAKTVSYQTTLTLTDIETGLIAWNGKVNIKKRFNRSSLGW